jgi:pSer/pThr/pTyr-binding forkhead associated (FHA) protein
VIRSAARDLATPAQESFILAPQQVQAAPAAPETPRGRFVVVDSPAVETGSSFEPGPVPLTIGRAEDNTIALEDDEYASGHHARIELRRDGVWLLDLDSTNGTWVNGQRMDGRHRVQPGDVVKIGNTELRYDL